MKIDHRDIDALKVAPSLGQGTRLGDNRGVGFALQEERQWLAERGVIVDEKDANQLTTSKSNRKTEPPLAAGSIVNSEPWARTIPRDR